MLRSLAFLCLLSISGTALAQVTFEKTGFAEVLRKAKREQKTVFVYLYTDWCAPCKQIDTTVFTYPKIRKLLDSQYVCLKLNAEKGEGIQINKKYGTEAYPLFVFIDSDGKKLGQIIGTRSNENYFTAIESNGENDPGRRVPKR